MVDDPLKMDFGELDPAERRFMTIRAAFFEALVPLAKPFSGFGHEFPDLLPSPA